MSAVIPFPRRPGPFVEVLRGLPFDSNGNPSRWYLAYSETGDAGTDFNIVSDRAKLSEILEDARYWKSEGCQVVHWGIV